MTTATELAGMVATVLRVSTVQCNVYSKDGVEAAVMFPGLTPAQENKMRDFVDSMEFKMGEMNGTTLVHL